MLPLFSDAVEEVLHPLGLLQRLVVKELELRNLADLMSDPRGQLFPDVIGKGLELSEGGLTLLGGVAHHARVYVRDGKVSRDPSPRDRHHRLKLVRIVSLEDAGDFSLNEFRDAFGMNTHLRQGVR